MSYKIIRFYKDEHPPETIKTGLTLDEAQAHCQDDETSSSTCSSSEGMARTAAMGDWFDGYDED
jgi:hypothetical protein